MSAAAEMVESVDAEALEKMEAAFEMRLSLEEVKRRGGNEVGYREMIKVAAARALEDGFRFGYRNPVWDLAEKQLEELRNKFSKGIIYLIILGGHRAGKSQYAAWKVTGELVRKAGARWWCADATEAASRDNQQRYLEQYLPAEWRPGESGVLEKRRRKTTKVRFSVAGGFTENALVLPNKSEARFKFYEQKLSTLQAVALDGFWGDELLPYDWIEEIEWRLVERNGLFLCTFTPYEGWTQTVGKFVEGAQVIEQSEADPELLPDLSRNGARHQRGEKIYRVLQCSNERARVVYFYSSDNPIFGNWPAVKSKAKTLGAPVIRMRVYGMVDKSAQAAFPLFREDVHVLKLKDYELLKRKSVNKEGIEQGERTHLVDPCSGRMWFMIWVWCVAPERWVIYREYPTTGHAAAYIPGVGDPGPWAELGEPVDGVAGTAQQNRGFSLLRYKQEIKRVEGDETIIERWMDARFGNSPQQQRDAGPTTLIEEMAELGMDFRAMVSETKILGVNDGSIDMLNSMIYYDVNNPIGKFSEELGRLNEPKLHVLETCPNVIFALKNWTGIDGSHGACKDGIDCLRGMVLSQVGLRDPSMYVWNRS